MSHFSFDTLSYPIGNCVSPCESNCSRWAEIIITPGRMSIGQIENQLQYLPVQNTLTINANEILNINVKIDLNSSIKYQLLDYLGNIQKSEYLISNDGAIEVNTKGLLNGVYFLYIEADSRNVVFKVIII